MVNPPSILSSQPRHVLIVGAGAAGYFAAIACAESYPQLRVTLLEAGSIPLAKVRISGGGRCNVTHACFDPAALVQHYPRGGKALRGALSRFQPKDVVQWFQQRGVRLKTEADGRMFPVTDDANTIVNCLMQAAEDAAVQLRTRAVVTDIQPLPTDTGGFQVSIRTGEQVRCDRLLLATGGSPHGHRLAVQLGHTIEPPVPSLFTFNLTDPRLRDLAGITVNPVHLTLYTPSQTLSQTGPLLITHWGISGPAVLKLSAWGARALHNCSYQTNLRINWLPHLSSDQLRQQVLDYKQAMGKRAIATHCPFPLPRRLWQSLVAHLSTILGIDPQTQWAQLSKSLLHQLVQELGQGDYRITGKGIFKEEFVTCGGVSLRQVDFKTMASRLCPGLYFAGEILDIDGVTGGFNFQSAWTTGWLAGHAMGKD